MIYDHSGSLIAGWAEECSVDVCTSCTHLTRGPRTLEPNFHNLEMLSEFTAIDHRRGTQTGTGVSNCQIFWGL